MLELDAELVAYAVGGTNADRFMEVGSEVACYASSDVAQ